MLRRSALWDGDPRVKPPFGAAELDWGHTLARALESFACFDAGLQDFTSRRGWSFSTRAKFDTGSAGAGVSNILGAGAGASSSLTPSPVLSIAAASNWSDWVYYSATAFDGGNPGLWRSGGGGGNTFHIVQGGNLRVWVRLDGTDILLPGSGTAHTTGLQTTGVSCVTSTSVTEYINGVQSQTASHSVATPAFTIQSIQWQSDTTESWSGVYYAFGVWSRALRADEYAWLSAEPYAMLRASVRRRYFVPAPAASLTRSFGIISG